MIDPLWLILAAVVLLICAAVLWWADTSKPTTSLFTRSDAELAEEWHRGAAAGAIPKNVRSALIDDREFFTATLGDAQVIATRRPQHSDIVLDFRTFESETDLLPVTTVAGYEMFSNDVTVATRAVDERMTAALGGLKAEAVWAESDWVLAQYTDQNPADLTTALGLFADATSVLPPRSPKPLQLLDPPRPLVAAPVVTETEEAPEVAKPVRLEPVEKPTRKVTQALGVVEPRPVGVDDIDAIAEGPAQLPKTDGTRIVRPQDRPTIF